jgi:NTE family protein
MSCTDGTSAGRRTESVDRGRTRVNLALQGGGAHGAFTWGVLDRLLEEPDLDFAGISGTSAGAVNASLLAYGLALGDRTAAREKLTQFWRRIAALTAMSPMQPTAIDRWFGFGKLQFSPAYWALELSSRLFSPYDFNAFDVNPVRETLSQCIDFDVLRDIDGPPLFISATNVREGRVKIFRRPEMSLEAVLASTCLPFLHRAVEIEGEAYWDGGYLGNPAVLPLYEETDCRDILVVQVNPTTIDEVPTTAQDIFDRMNTITFNAGLMRELHALQTAAHEARECDNEEPVRLHRIHGDDTLRGLGVSSKLNADWRFLRHLRDVGRATAEDWLGEHRPALGERSTLEPMAMYV